MVPRGCAPASGGSRAGSAGAMVIAGGSFGRQAPDPIPCALDHLRELFQGARVHDHEVRPSDPLGPAGLAGDPRLGVGPVRPPQVHQPFQHEIARRVHDDHTRETVRIRASILDQQGDVDHDDGLAA